MDYRKSGRLYTIVRVSASRQKQDRSVSFCQIFPMRSCSASPLLVCRPSCAPAGRPVRLPSPCRQTLGDVCNAEWRCAACEASRNLAFSSAQTWWLLAAGWYSQWFTCGVCQVERRCCATNTWCDPAEGGWGPWRTSKQLSAKATLTLPMVTGWVSFPSLCAAWMLTMALKDDACLAKWMN